MYSRNKQKDNNPMGGFLSVKVASTIIPMGVLGAIYASLALTVGNAI